MPTYNRASLIMRAIDSVLKQTYPHFELLVVDDGSTDNTSDLIGEINDSRVRYKIIDHWGGPARPRNTGIRNSHWPYIALIDDDDQWHPQKLAMIAGEIQLHPKAVLLFHDRQIVSSSGRPRTPKQQKIQYPVTARSILLGHVHIPNSAAVLKKDAVDLIGGISELREDISVEDLDLWIRLSEVGPVRFIERNLSNYTADHDHTQISNNSDFLIAGMRVRERHSLTWVIENPHDKFLIVTGLAKFYFSAVIQLVKRKDLSGSRHVMARYIKFVWALARSK